MDRIAQMQTFLHVVEAGNFTRAAQRAGVPRSTVSNAVQALEDRLGVQLLHRTTRVVRPTPDGLKFADSVRAILEAVAQAERQFLPDPGQVSGRLRVEMPGRIARCLVIPQLRDFRALHPGLEIDIGASDRLTDIIGEGVDAVLRLAELGDSDLICHRIGRVPMLTCASPCYLSRHGTPSVPAELERHLLVNYAHRMPAVTAEWEGTKDGAPLILAMRSEICVDSTESYVAAALAGHGLVQVPVRDVAAEIAAGQLVEVLAPYRPEPVALSVLYVRRRQVAPKVRVFITWLAQLMRDEGFVES